LDSYILYSARKFTDPVNLEVQVERVL